MSDPSEMSDPSAAEERLRERLASYGAALAREADLPARRRHLVAVDGTPGSVAGGPGGSGRRRTPWRGPVARVAAAAAVLAVLAGTTWAATRPTDTSTTTIAEGGWSDADRVRPEDRASAFAALDGTWPLPPSASLRFVIDRNTSYEPTFGELRRMLAADAACLWFRYALEQPSLTADERASVSGMPSWPGISPADDGVRDLVAAALAGPSGDDALRRHLTASCGGTAVGLGLPEIGGYWLAPERTDDEVTAAPDRAGGGSATAIDPASVPRWERISGRLGPEVEVVDALALPDGAVNVRLVAGAVDLSLTIGRLRDRVALPVDEATFDRGFSLRGDGIEVFAGPVGQSSVAQVVGPDGVSIALASDSAVDVVERALGPLSTLAVDLHRAAWPR